MSIIIRGKTTYGAKSVIANDSGLYLDAANIRSYPLSGAIWYNLCPKNSENFDMIGGVSHSTNDAGVMTLSVPGDRAQSDTTTFFDSPTSMSIFAWFKLSGNVGAFRCVVHKGSAASVGSSDFWVGGSSSNLLTATIGGNTGGRWYI